MIDIYARYCVFFILNFVERNLRYTRFCLTLIRDICFEPNFWFKNRFCVTFAHAIPYLAYSSFENRICVILDLFDIRTRYSCSRLFCGCWRFLAVAHVFFEKWRLWCCCLRWRRYYYWISVHDLLLVISFYWTVFRFMIYCVRLYFIEPYFGSYYAAVDAPPPLLHRLWRQHREDMGRRLPSTARRAERPHEGSDVSCVRREREVLGVRWGGRGLTRVGTCFPAISRMLCRCCDAFKINCAFDDVAATTNWYLRVKMLWWLWNELVLDGFAILLCDLKCHCCLKLAMNCVVM